MAYKEKDTKKWTAQWFETNAKGEKRKRRKRGFETKREALEYERQKKLNNSRSMDKMIKKQRKKQPGASGKARMNHRIAKDLQSARNALLFQINAI